MSVKVAYFVEHGWPVTGIIHVGASDGEEVPEYRALGINNIICFEPLKSAVAAFKKRNPDVMCLPYGLSDKTGRRILNISAGDGKGTSALKVIKDHPEVVEKWNHGQAEIVGKQTAQFVRFDQWIEKTALLVSSFNCLIVDAQGMSYEVLKGFGKYLDDIDYLVVELSETPVYSGESPAQDVIDFLSDKGFERLSEVQPHDDVLFRRVK